MLKARHLRHPLRTLVMAYDYYSSAFYDWKHGIRTAKVEPLATLQLARPENLAHANSYLASQPEDIRSVFKNLDVDFQKYCFVDYGCGKGRVLAEAVRYPFKSRNRHRFRERALRGVRGESGKSALDTALRRSKNFKCRRHRIRSPARALRRLHLQFVSRARAGRHARTHPQIRGATFRATFASRT